MLLTWALTFFPHTVASQSSAFGANDLTWRSAKLSSGRTNGRKSLRRGTMLTCTWSQTRVLSIIQAKGEKKKSAVNPRHSKVVHRYIFRGFPSPYLTHFFNPRCYYRNGNVLKQAHWYEPSELLLQKMNHHLLSNQNRAFNSAVV